MAAEAWVISGRMASPVPILVGAGAVIENMSRNEPLQQRIALECAGRRRVQTKTWLAVPFSPRPVCAKLCAVDALVFENAENRPALRRPALIIAFSGWNDAGQSASAAVRYVAEQFDAQPLAVIDPDEFYDFTVQRPQVRLVDGQHREVTWIKNEFHFTANPALARDLIFGWGPEPHLKWKTFCANVLRLAGECGSDLLVTLGGYLAEVLYSRPVPVTGFASDPALLEKLDLSTTRYEGPTGIVGVLGDVCRREGLAHVSLWAALPHYIAAVPNPRGALALLVRLTAFLNLPVDLAPLQESAAAFEQKVNEAVAEDPKLSAYIRELKKREFAN
jgi:proteasome assembly chaperone (PAC2) family protein